jgi:hypothetical protein
MNWVVSSSTRPDERSYKLIWIWLYEVVAQNPDLMDTSVDVTISRSESALSFVNQHGIKISRGGGGKLNCAWRAERHKWVMWVGSVDDSCL